MTKQTTTGPTLVLEMRDVLDEDAYREVRAYFGVAQSRLYYSQISENLLLPVEQVVRVCKRLTREGVIGEP